MGCYKFTLAETTTLAKSQPRTLDLWISRYQSTIAMSQHASFSPQREKVRGGERNENEIDYRQTMRQPERSGKRGKTQRKLIYKIYLDA